jgi:hypothetical protein
VLQACFNIAPGDVQLVVEKTNRDGERRLTRFIAAFEQFPPIENKHEQIRSGRRRAAMGRLLSRVERDHRRHG